jgi:hypothetical protein
MAQAPALPRGFELPLEPRLPRIGSVDQVAVEARAGELAKRSITMSTSSAPWPTTQRTSSSFASSGAWPDGKAVATDATLTPVPRSRSRAVGTRFG